MCIRLSQDRRVYPNITGNLLENFLLYTLRTWLIHSELTTYTVLPIIKNSMWSLDKANVVLMGILTTNSFKNDATKSVILNHNDHKTLIATSWRTR